MLLDQRFLTLDILSQLRRGAVELFLEARPDFEMSWA